MIDKNRTCDECGKAIVQGSVSTGYGTDEFGRRICYECIAMADRATMTRDGHSKRLPLYLSGNEVTNWPGTLRFNIVGRKTGRHNISGTRKDVWFYGPDGAYWHGTVYGENTQVCHCKRTKQ